MLFRSGQEAQRAHVSVSAATCLLGALVVRHDVAVLDLNDTVGDCPQQGTDYPVLLLIPPDVAVTDRKKRDGMDTHRKIGTQGG